MWWCFRFLCFVLASYILYIYMYIYIYIYINMYLCIYIMYMYIYSVCMYIYIYIYIVYIYIYTYIHTHTYDVINYAIECHGYASSNKTNQVSDTRCSRVFFLTLSYRQLPTRVTIAALIDCLPSSVHLTSRMTLTTRDNYLLQCPVGRHAKECIITYARVTASRIH